MIRSRRTSTVHADLARNLRRIADALDAGEVPPIPITMQLCEASALYGQWEDNMRRGGFCCRPCAALNKWEWLTDLRAYQDHCASVHGLALSGLPLVRDREAGIIRMRED